jgi:hypothetical protein
MAAIRVSRPPLNHEAFCQIRQKTPKSSPLNLAVLPNERLAQPFLKTKNGGNPSVFLYPKTPRARPVKVSPKGDHFSRTGRAALRCRSLACLPYRALKIFSG